MSWRPIVDLPPLGPIAPSRPLPAETRRAFDAFVAVAAASLPAEEGHPRRSRFDPAAVEAAWAELDRPDLSGAPLLALLACSTYPGRPAGDALRRFAQEPALELVHLLRMLALVESSIQAFPDCADDVLTGEVARWVLPEIDRRGWPVGLRELAAAARSVGLNGAAFGRAPFDLTWGDDYALEVERLWPFYAEDPSYLELVLGVAGKKDPDLVPAGAVGRRIAALHILECLPAPPADWLERIWEVALDSRYDDRHAARRYLARDSDVTPRVVGSLGASSRPTRRGAADWLGRAAELAAAAVPALRAAYAGEKERDVRLEIASALARRGAALDAPMERGEVASRAARSGALPEQLAWFHWSAPPEARWAGDPGQPVPLDVLRWLVVEAWRGRDPRPSPELRGALGVLAPASRSELALVTVKAWLDLDRTGASAHFGLAALGAAAGDERVVDLALAAIRQSSSTLTLRCRALVRMLAEMEEPAAVRGLLALRATMRTASVRKEAEEALELVAERRGWTAADLEDSAAPWLGLALEGARRLEGGDAVVALDDDGELQVVAGNVAAAELRKLRKPVADVWKGQLRRFEEALVTGRTWAAADWRASVWGHPLLRVASRRLLWSVVPDPAAATDSFRPLGDDGAVDAFGRAVALPPGRYRLAHRLHLDAEVAQAWQRQVDGNAFVPLLAQLRPAHAVGADQQGSRMFEIPPSAWREVDRRAAERFARARGYVRGRGYDSGQLFRYLKPFPAADLVAYLEVCEMGTEAVPTMQIRGFCFSRAGARSATAEGFDIPRLRFGQVPAVLWSETRQDLEDLLALPEIPRAHLQQRQEMG